jgi:hypothetical protein
VTAPQGERRATTPSAPHPDDDRIEVPRPAPAPPRKVPAFDASALVQPTRYDPDMKRPSTTTAGSVLVLLRAVAGIYTVIDLIVNWAHLRHEAGLDGESQAVTIGSFILILIAVGMVPVVDILMAWLIYRGHNWPRVLVMSITVVSVTSTFIAWWWQGQQVTIHTTLFSLGLDILVLLALSSRSAAAYARRNHRPPEPDDA